MLTSQRIEDIINIGGNDKMSREIRGSPPTVVEWMIIGWVVGKCIHIVQCVQRLQTCKT